MSRLRRGHPPSVSSSQIPPKHSEPKHSHAVSDQEVRIEIESIAYGGAGVGKTDGLVVFVPLTIPKEEVLARPVRQKKRFCEAELVQILKPSPIRQPPACEWFGSCGGCAYQHVPYAIQLEWKTNQVRELFQRIGGMQNPPVTPAVGSPRPFGYRNRIRVHASGRHGNLRIGFYARGGREIVDVGACSIASNAVNAQLAALRRSQPSPGEYLLSDRPDVLFFEQTNDGAATVLADIVTSLTHDGQQLLVDAYCGAGFFGNLLAPRFEQVVGVESHHGAVHAAQQKAGPRESYICGDVSVLLPSLLEGANLTRTTVLLDPPAAGLPPAVVESLGRHRVAHLLYVSCDPATQARDLKALLKHGYHLESVTPVDMFPQTSDIEVVASMHYAPEISP